MCCPRLGEDRSGTDVQMLSFVHDPKKMDQSENINKEEQKAIYDPLLQVIF